MRGFASSIFIIAAIASVLCFGQKIDSNIIRRLENSRFEDYDEGKNGYYKYQSEIIAPYAKHTDILKGFALLSNDDNQFYAVPKQKAEGTSPPPRASVTITPRHCLKYPEQKNFTSCLCYAADFEKLSNDMSKSMELCYARNMVPICVTFTGFIKERFTYLMQYYDEHEQSIKSMLFDTATEGVEFHFDEQSANIYINKGKSETTFSVLPPLYTTMYPAFGENTVKAVEFKSHDCVSFTFDGLIYGGNLLTTTPSTLPSFPTGCKSKCLCQSDVGNKISFNGTLGTLESGAMNYHGTNLITSMIAVGILYILTHFIA